MLSLTGNAAGGAGHGDAATRLDHCPAILTLIWPLHIQPPPGLRDACLAERIREALRLVDVIHHGGPASRPSRTAATFRVSVRWESI